MTAVKVDRWTPPNGPNLPNASGGTMVSLTSTVPSYISDRDHTTESANDSAPSSATPTNTTKRPRIDRAGARERGGALSRLSGGFLNKK